MRRREEGPWFRDWFGAEYLALYPHRDQEEARSAVRLLMSALRPRVGTRVLDLACGAGRHQGSLAEVGDRLVVQRRRIEGSTVVKNIEIRHADPVMPDETYEERVRLYEPGELGGLLRAAGLRVETRFGGYDGRPAGPESERILLAGRRA